MALLMLDPIPSDRFTYIPEKRLMVAEASTIRLPFRRIYDDACDIGLAVRSARSGEVVTFVVSQEYRRDGDVTHWDVVPIPEHRRRARKVRIRIWND